MPHIPEFVEPCRKGVVHPIYNTYHFNQNILVHPLITTQANLPQVSDTIISTGTIEQVQDVLLNKDPNEALTLTGATALHIASAAGNLQVLGYLSTLKNIDFNKQDKEGETALFKASFRGHATVVELLLAKGATPISVLLFHARILQDGLHCITVAVKVI